MPNAPTKSRTMRCHGDEWGCQKSSPRPRHTIMDVKMTGKEVSKDETDPNHKKLKDSMILEIILNHGKHD